MRAALLTGRYPFRHGMGTSALPIMHPAGLPLDEKLLPEYLREAGYDTHLVGKWHLGFCNSSYHPLNRGFDSFYGFYGSQISYETHETINNMRVTDWFDNFDPILSNEYSTTAFGRKTRELFGVKKDVPKFVYLSLNAPHVPISAPADLFEEYREMFPTLPETRIELLAAIRAVDIQMELIMKDLALLDKETLVVFQSDNGGVGSTLAINGRRHQAACNFPFNGYKDTLNEGGTLSPTFVYSTKNRYPEREVTSLFHIVDWMPTLLWYAKAPIPPGLDGVNQQIHLQQNASLIFKQRRTSFVYGLKHMDHNGSPVTRYAVRKGNFKFYNYQRDVQTISCDISDADLSRQMNKVPNPEKYKEQLQRISVSAKDRKNPVYNDNGLITI